MVIFRMMVGCFVKETFVLDAVCAECVNFAQKRTIIVNYVFPFV